MSSQVFNGRHLHSFALNTIWIVSKPQLQIRMAQHHNNSSQSPAGRSRERTLGTALNCPCKPSRQAHVPFANGAYFSLPPWQHSPANCADRSTACSLSLMPVCPALPAFLVYVQRPYQRTRASDQLRRAAGRACCWPACAGAAQHLE